MPPAVARHQHANPLAPNTVSVDGLAQAGFLPSRFRANRPGRGSNPADRRVTSHFNYFSSRSNISTDSPPTYSRSQHDSRFPVSRRSEDGGNEVLPQYSCTIYKESVMHMRVEACSPFMMLPFQEWRAVYVVICGTQLNVHKIKTTTIGRDQVPGVGKLLRSYTLQHGEVGLAPDVDYSITTPNTKLAALIPLVARRRALQKDPDLFTVETYHSLRIRSELDQFLLAHPEEEQIISWVNHVCAGIDIAPAIDDRALPRQTTMPRRRRRRQVDPTDLTDERVIEQQRRMLAMYPSLAADPPDPSRLAPPTTVSRAQSVSLNSRPSDLSCPANTSSQPSAELDGEDIDLSVLAEEQSGARPTSPLSVTTRSDSLGPSRSNSHVTSVVMPAANFDEDGKWAPQHPRSAAHQWRYMKRCMPVLLPETARHSSIMISDGRYVRPNYKLDTLEEWTSQPPAYDAHKFTAAQPGLWAITTASPLATTTTSPFAATTTSSFAATTTPSFAATTMLSSAAEDDTEEEGEQASRNSSSLEQQTTRHGDAAVPHALSTLSTVVNTNDRGRIDSAAASPTDSLTGLGIERSQQEKQTQRQQRHAQKPECATGDDVPVAGLSGVFTLRPARSRAKLFHVAVGNSEGERPAKRSIFGF